MTDIVELLRAAMPECCYPAELAADEIERLRAERDALLAALVKREKKSKQQRRALRQLNKAHTILWRVVRLQVEKLVESVERKT
jgi:hypothetical protein